MLNKHWTYDEDLEKVINVSHKKSLKILEEQKLIEKVLKTTGLK